MRSSDAAGGSRDSRLQGDLARIRAAKELAGGLHESRP
jgi:hypothetical protein